MSAIFLTDQQVAELLNLADAIAAIEKVMRQQAAGKALNVPRSALRLAGCSLHVMSGGGGGEYMGLKAYTTHAGWHSFALLLFSAQDGSLLAHMEADTLSLLRTGAATALGARLMSRPDACVLGLIGAGHQARGQVLGLSQVRKLERVRVFCRTGPRERFREAFQPEVAAALEPVESAEAAVREADLVVTATTSAEPVLHGDWLAPGVHITAMGSAHLHKRELDESVIARCHRIVVDSVEQAKLECGDLLWPIEQGMMHWGQVGELKDVVSGRLTGRAGPDEITLFKFHGIALWDIAIAALVYERARQAGLGTSLGA